MRQGLGVCRSLCLAAGPEYGTFQKALRSHAASFPSASHACGSILFSAGLLPPPRGHFLMPFLNLAPVPPKSNQIHNLIRQKNEENVHLPASPLTGRRPEANLENVTTTGRTTDWWGGGGAHFLELPIVRSRRDPAGGPPGLRFPNQVVDTPSRTQKCVESNSRGSHLPRLGGCEAQAESPLGDTSPPSQLGLCKSRHFLPLR